MDSTFSKRLAYVEAQANLLKSQQEDILRLQYEVACEEGDAELAAEAARALRNKLLDKTDAQMTLDRVGLDSSSSAKFLASLFNIFTGSWAMYRQALRDIPEQEGFPFNIKFPVAPGETEQQDI